MTQEEQKQAAARAALAYIEDDTFIGVGTGSTVKYFIEGLVDYKHRIEGAVASSVQTEALLKSLGVPVVDLNSAHPLALYVDGADEVDKHKRMIKGGGAALTREKITAAVAQKFVCIVDASKRVDVLGREFPLPIEVIPMARSYVAREIVKLGGDPNYREGVITDNGNCILDIYHLNITDALGLEQQLNAISGVVCHGLFAKRSADIVLVGNDQGVQKIT